MTDIMKAAYVMVAFAGGFIFLFYAMGLFLSGERQTSVFFYYVAALGIIFGSAFLGVLGYD